MDKWSKAQEWEREWHGNCVNSIGEELKQFAYAHKMGIKFTPNEYTPYNIDLKGKSVLDIGGGAYSLLLKAINKPVCFVADPLMNKYPQWVVQRYVEAAIFPLSTAGEDLPEISEFGDGQSVDEVWIYNCLQHTRDPEKIIKNARNIGKVIRIFEWINTKTNVGHPHSLNADLLNQWLGGEGKTGNINEYGAVGEYYAGIFKGDHYEEV